MRRRPVLRRTGWCLVLGLLGAAIIGTGTASAHLCTIADQIAVGKLQTISIGVTVEGEPIPDFEIQVPAELRVDRVDPAEGFRITRRGQTLRYRGGPIAPYACKYVTLGVTAKSKGAFGVPVTQRRADGSVVAHSTIDPTQKLNPYFEQVVYAGVKAPPPPSQGSGGTSVVTYAGIILIAIAVIAIVALGIRSWRNRGFEDVEDEDTEGERDRELQSRVEQFKKQTRDRAEPQ